MKNLFGDVLLILIGEMVALPLVVSSDTQKELERMSGARQAFATSRRDPEVKLSTGICTDACYDPDSPIHCEFLKTRWNEDVEYYKNHSYLNDTFTQKWADEAYKNCTELLESDERCGSCLKYMHIKNPITICLLLLFIILVAAAIAANVMFIKGIGPFEKCRAKMMNSSPQTNPETGLEGGNAYYAYQNPPTDAVGVDATPSQSPTHNVVP